MYNSHSLKTILSEIHVIKLDPVDHLNHLEHKKEIITQMIRVKSPKLTTCLI